MVTRMFGNLLVRKPQGPVVLYDRKEVLFRGWKRRGQI
jgi:hypothetical protein